MTVVTQTAIKPSKPHQHVLVKTQQNGIYDDLVDLSLGRAYDRMEMTHAAINISIAPNMHTKMSQVADSLEKGTEHEDEYMISEKELLVNQFISVPKDMGTFNCGAFVAGIVRGVLDGAGFPAVVTSYFVPVEGQLRPRTTILIKFAEEDSKLVIILIFDVFGYEAPKLRILGTGS